MIDRALRRRTAPALDRVGSGLHRAGVRAGWLTGAGWGFGIGACVAAGTRSWTTALVLWLANRALDGLDGPVARAGTGPTERGAYLDILADFSVYGGFAVAVGIAEPSARTACLGLLLAYYVSGSAFLALSSLEERRRADTVDERSLRFVGGLAEGAETIAVYVLICLLPGRAGLIAWAFTAAVGVTAAQRAWLGARRLVAVSPDDRTEGPSAPTAGMGAAEQRVPGDVTTRASWNGQVVAESDDTLVVEGNHYFPPDSVRRELLAPSAERSLCPWKGRARYYDVVVDGHVNPAAAWYYPKPWLRARRLRDRVAFWNGVVVEQS